MLLKREPNQFFGGCDHWIWWISLTIGHLFYTTPTFVHCLVAVGKFTLEETITIRKHSIWVKFIDFWRVRPRNLMYDLKQRIRRLFCTSSSFVHHFVAIHELKLDLKSGNAQFRSKLSIFWTVWPWNLMDDLENKRAPLLHHLKLCASFHSHQWIKTGVMIRKHPNGGKICFAWWDLALSRWPFAWTSLLSELKTSENFIVIRWCEHECSWKAISPSAISDDFFKIIRYIVLSSDKLFLNT